MAVSTIGILLDPSQPKCGGEVIKWLLEGFLVCKMSDFWGQVLLVIATNCIKKPLCYHRRLLYHIVCIWIVWAIEDVGCLDGNVQRRKCMSKWSSSKCVYAKQAPKSPAQMQRHIAQFCATHILVCKLLSVLLQYVNDDILLGMIFQQLITYKIEATGIFAQFMPFLQGKISLCIAWCSNRSGIMRSR